MSERTNFFGDSGATFSDCGLYRYRLHRTWDAAKPSAAFIMLNPSTATESILDPTIRRCIGYSARWGYGGLVVGNLFALRSTNPNKLYDVADPIGPENDIYLREIALSTAIVICAWGKYGALVRRGDAVLSMLRGLGVIPRALKLNRDGSPAHPLYQRGDAEPFEMAA